MECATCTMFRQSDGTCHSAPPVRLPRKFDPGASAGNRVRDETLLWGWPEVSPDDFCGAYSQRLAVAPRAAPVYSCED